MNINIINPSDWKKDIPTFREKTAEFYSGEMKKNEYKGFSGRYGSYAQRNSFNMLRLRMTAGRITKEKLAFIVDAIKKHSVNMVHFTTCQAVQFHNLEQNAVCDIMEAALDVDIVTMGGGGDFPRNIMCSPLSGVEVGENFDVLPYAEITGKYMMNFINAPKMPRKLKICFSNSQKNMTHATFRDLGFVSRPDKKFDVYSAGGLGNNPKFGVKVAEAIEPEKILYYVKAMWLTFTTYGDYNNRGKARTRYMQDILGGPENYKKAYLEKLDEVFASGENLDIEVASTESKKVADGIIEDKRIIAQKQNGLYTVIWHPIGGQPSIKTLCNLNDALTDIEDAEIRISPDETAYIINLTAKEAAKILDITDDGAKTLFETSVSCIGASICQVGLRDSQALLAKCIQAVRKANIKDGALPQIHISGCPSSCGTHQTGSIGFRGASARVDGKPCPAFLLYVNGNDYQGKETMGYEVGTIIDTKIPAFLVELGQTVANSGMDYAAWNEANPGAIDTIAKKYIG
ncbi:MAG: nitrite/sulfite reductase [Lachnospiraceae bacterium]